MDIEEIETPAVLVDVERLDRNIARMQAHADRQGVALHPHVKTHKCLEIARRQLAAGAAGLTASKPAEAEVFLSAGAAALTVAYPILSSERIARLVELARRKSCHLRLIVDSTETLAAAGTRRGDKLDCFLKVDVGLGRVGVVPGSTQADEVGRALGTAPGLAFFGLLSHAGHAYGAGTPGAILEIADQERRTLDSVRHALVEAGVGPATSVGCTPTALAEAKASAPAGAVTEMRPGNYVFLDLMALQLGLAKLDDLALFVLTTVVSVGPRHAIIDAGSKTLTSDLGPHGARSLQGYGQAFRLTQDGSFPNSNTGSEPLLVERLSEEHGFVRLDGQRLVVGDRLLVAPNHACPVVNLTRRLTVVAHGVVQNRWQVDARV